jgi:hypothetical protein
MNFSFGSSFRSRPLLLTVALCATSLVVSATPVTGQFNIGGTARVTFTSLDFIPPVGGGTGIITTFPGANTGTFSVLNAGFTPGTLTDRDASQVIGAPLNVANWLVLSALPDLNFTLHEIIPGQFSSAACASAPANQQSCTLPPLGGSLSPYNLTNFVDAQAGLSSTASFSVRGTVTDPTGPASNFVAVFTATFLGRPYQSLINDLTPGSGGPGFVDAPFAATFTVAPVPEPGSMMLGFSGLALVGGSMLFRRRRSQQ